MGCFCAILAFASGTTGGNRVVIVTRRRRQCNTIFKRRRSELEIVLVSACHSGHGNTRQVALEERWLSTANISTFQSDLKLRPSNLPRRRLLPLLCPARPPYTTIRRMAPLQRITAKMKTFFRKITGARQQTSTQGNSDRPPGYQDQESGQGLEPVSQGGTGQPPHILGWGPPVSGLPSMNADDVHLSQGFGGVVLVTNSDHSSRPPSPSYDRFHLAGPIHANNESAQATSSIHGPPEGHGRPPFHSPVASPHPMFGPPASPSIHSIQGLLQASASTPPSAFHGDHAGPHRFENADRNIANSSSSALPLSASQMRSQGPSPVPYDSSYSTSSYFQYASGVSIGQMNTSNVQNFASTKTVFERESCIFVVIHRLTGLIQTSSPISRMGPLTTRENDSTPQRALPRRDEPSRRTSSVG